MANSFMIFWVPRISPKFLKPPGYNCLVFLCHQIIPVGCSSQQTSATQHKPPDFRICLRTVSPGIGWCAGLRLLSVAFTLTGGRYPPGAACSRRSRLRFIGCANEKVALRRHKRFHRRLLFRSLGQARSSAPTRCRSPSIATPRRRLWGCRGQLGHPKSNAQNAGPMDQQG